MVLFDLELILLFPLIFKTSMFFMKMKGLLIILMFILMTLMWEWSVHGLKWSS